jgi:hypothetical protein
MTVKEMAELIGKPATYTFHVGKSFVSVDMNILDAKEVFGRQMVELAPVSGTGTIWANLDNIKIEEAS